MTTVSIAMTTYNGESYLQEQLDSFLAQSVLPDELVVCDDCSTDGTFEILESFKESAPFDVRLFKNEKNLGYAQNFSKAMGLCSGDYVFLSDQDDVWLPDKIESVLKVFENKPAVQLVIHDLEFCDADLVPIGQKKIERVLLASNSLENYVTGMATAVRADFLKLCLPVPLQAFTHDAWLHACASMVSARSVMPKVLALYRRHDANASSDLLINQQKKLERADLVVDRKLIKTSIKSYEKPLDRNIALKNWLQVQADYLIAGGYVSRDMLQSAEQALDQEIYSLSARVNILNAAKWRKPLLAVKFYLAGGYKKFNGFKSLIKDIFIN